MLTAESYKSRMETGLSFLEFNYMVMQAYDFLVLFKQNGVKLQLGGQDQWGNIVAGIELIRRETGGAAFGATMPLLIDPRTREKFGKTNSGAVWLSAERTSVYDFYQFWRNVSDTETGRLLNIFTFLPLPECHRLSTLEGNFINRAKEILAYEVTSICHGEKLANEAYAASIEAFGSSDPNLTVETSSKIMEVSKNSSKDLPSVSISKNDLEPLDYPSLFVLAELASSKGEAKRLIRQGGAYIDEEQINVASEKTFIKDTNLFDKPEFTLRAGKKRYKTIKVLP
jgi:tyrosyl-tRNA synthetase